MITRVLLTGALSLLIFFGCKDESKPDKKLNEKFNFSQEEYQKVIAQRIKDENFRLNLTDSLFLYSDTLVHLYSERDFKPFFIKSYEEEDFVNSVLILLEKADEHGLDKENYHFSAIANNFYDAINDTINNPQRLIQLADAEILLTDALLKYSYHLRYGIINPKQIFPDSYTLPVVDSTDRDLTQPLRQSDVINYLYSIQPKSEKYKKLQKALASFNKLKDVEWKLIETSSKIEPGDANPALPLIAKRLSVLGLIDTAKIKPDSIAVYDSFLIESVKKFQRLHGLNDDGIIGKETIERLNITPQEYITTIKINLERFRWNDYSDTSKYILVNIPDFKLYVIENGKELFDIKVCVGSKRYANYDKRMEIYKKTKKYYDKPDDWETPCLYGEISYMVLNPTWTVPASIIREEIVRELKKDSSYLISKNFKVYKNGVELKLEEVNIQEFSSEKIPYTVVQDPGAGNALGKIKFMFKNPFGVYLHDTPTRAPFSYSNRAVSHGCVRVEKPLMLSEYILKDHPDWDIDYLRIEIGQEPEDKSKIEEYKNKRKDLRKNRSFGKTTEIVLEKPVHLFIDYYTAWVDDNGNFNFREDVYRKDKKIKELLFPENKPQQLLSYMN